MEKIASFAIDHDILHEGIYLSRTDGDVITYDLRVKEPNKGDYVDNAVLHTFEHLFATFARNSEHAQSVVYFGPMGCRTGFYLLVRDSVSPADAIALVQDALAFIAEYEGDIPGSKKEECGNYLDHDLQGTKEVARTYREAVRNWTPEMLRYPGQTSETFV